MTVMTAVDDVRTCALCGRVYSSARSFWIEATDDEPGHFSDLCSACRKGVGRRPEALGHQLAVVDASEGVIKPNNVIKLRQPRRKAPVKIGEPQRVGEALSFVRSYSGRNRFMLAMQAELELNPHWRPTSPQAATILRIRSESNGRRRHV